MCLNMKTSVALLKSVIFFRHIPLIILLDSVLKKSKEFVKTEILFQSHFCWLLTKTQDKLAKPLGTVSVAMGEQIACPNHIFLPPVFETAFEAKHPPPPS